jgi:hypothetical protein
MWREAGSGEIINPPATYAATFDSEIFQSHCQP